MLSLGKCFRTTLAEWPINVRLEINKNVIRVLCFKSLNKEFMAFL